jgi:hypothetical protein
VEIWHSFSRFGVLYEEEFGNPDPDPTFAGGQNCLT